MKSARLAPRSRHAERARASPMLLSPARHGVKTSAHLTGAVLTLSPLAAWRIRHIKTASVSGPDKGTRCLVGCDVDFRLDKWVQANEFAPRLSFGLSFNGVVSSLTIAPAHFSFALGAAKENSQTGDVCETLAYASVTIVLRTTRLFRSKVFQASQVSEASPRKRTPPR